MAPNFLRLSGQRGDHQSLGKMRIVLVFVFVFEVSVQHDHVLPLDLRHLSVILHRYVIRRQHDDICEQKKLEKNIAPQMKVRSYFIFVATVWPYDD